MMHDLARALPLKRRKILYNSKPDIDFINKCVKRYTHPLDAFWMLELNYASSESKIRQYFGKFKLYLKFSILWYFIRVLM